MKMKMWIGNFDGRRMGLVIAPTQARARAIVGTGRSDFARYWRQQPSVDASLKFEMLYTRKIDGDHAHVLPPWQPGRCQL